MNSCSAAYRLYKPHEGIDMIIPVQLLTNRRSIVTSSNLAMPLSVAFLLGGSLFSLNAAAEETIEEAAPSSEAGAVEETDGSLEAGPKHGKIELTDSAPPAEAAVERTHHTHYGFYGRFSVGAGFSAWSVGDTNTSTDGNATTNGASLNMQLMIGTAPSPGIAFGGALLFDTLLSSSWQQDGAPQSSLGGAGMSQIIVGPFLDGFFDKRGGWHVGLAAGLAVMFPGYGGNTYPGNSAGLGGGGFFGYEGWVAPEWSMGMDLQLIGSYYPGEKQGSNVGASLLFSVLSN